MRTTEPVSASLIGRRLVFIRKSLSRVHTTAADDDVLLYVPDCCAAGRKESIYICSGVRE